MAGFLNARPRVGYFYTGKTGSAFLTEKVKQLKVRHFQSVPVAAKESDTVYDAVSAMFLGDVGTLFVVNDVNCLCGVLSRKDLLRTSMVNQDINSLPVHSTMTRMTNITICKPDDLLIESAKLLIDRQIDSLPVVKDTADGIQPVGRITKTNITKAFVELILE